MDENKNQPVDDFLAHHGVLGMKWGVWNEETARRRLGGGWRLGKGGGKASDKPKGKTSSKTKAGKLVESVRTKAVRKAKTGEGAKKPGKQQESAPSSTENSAEALRQRTLESTDPKVVKEGLHTLTDKEVEQKMKRMLNEQTIKKLDKSDVNSGKDKVSELLKTAAKERIVKPLINKAADTASQKLQEKLFGGIANATGTNPAAVAGAATAMKQIVESTASQALGNQANAAAQAPSPRNTPAPTSQPTAPSRPAPSAPSTNQAARPTPPATPSRPSAPTMPKKFRVVEGKPPTLPSTSTQPQYKQIGTRGYGMRSKGHSTVDQFSRYSVDALARYQKAGRNEVADILYPVDHSKLEDYSRDTWTSKGKSKVRGNLRPASSYGQQNWTFHTAINEEIQNV